MIKMAGVVALCAVLTAMVNLDATCASGTRDRLTSEWKGWSEDQQRYYLMGIMDTWVNIAVMEEAVRAKKPNPAGAGSPYKTLSDCISVKRLKYADAHAIVDSFILRTDGKNPDGQIPALASTAFSAIWEACGLQP